PGEKLKGAAAAADFLLSRDPAEGKVRLLRAANELYSAFALSAPADEALEVSDEVGFFQLVPAALVKLDPVVAWRQRAAVEGQLEAAMQQLVSRAIVSDEVVDVFQVAGLKKPDVSILSDEFLAEVRALPQRSLAAEMLERLLREQIGKSEKRNLVLSKQFSE